MLAYGSSGTLGQIIVSSIVRYADRDMLDDGRVKWTYRQLGDAIGRYVAILRDLGLQRGDGVAVLSSNRAEPWALLCAANLMGLRYTPMHPLAAEDDHVHIADDADLSALIVEAGKFTERGIAILQRVPQIKHFLTIGAAPQGRDISAQFDETEPAPLIVECQSEDIAWLAYTGGTTGRSKGVMLSHRAITAMTTIIMAEWEWPAVPRYALVTPISHAGGINLYPLIAQGGFARILQGFDLDAFCGAVQDDRLNATFLVPTIIGNLIDRRDEVAHYDVSSLELIVYGAAPMSPDRLRQGIGLFGPVFLQLYGQSESPQTITVLRKADHDLSRPERLGSCGTPVALVDVKLVDPDGHEVAFGVPGEICVRGPLMMSGYWRQPEMTAEAVRDGWVHTGDVAIRDEDGYLTIVDRTKDMIISGGFNIYPREVEDALMSHPAVSLAAVIGIPDAKWGEAVKAFVMLAPGAGVDEYELRALVKEKRGSPWSPKSIDFMDEIPLTGLGKIDRKALRSSYWGGQARAVS